jgi:drug/metabolite transporter (DMT)-like permease
MNRAFQEADITALQPVMFLQLVWATLLGLVMFDERPDLWIWIGGAIIVAAATVTARQETRVSTR